MKPEALDPSVGDGIANRAHRHVHLAVHIVQYGLHEGLPAGEEQVLGIGTPGAGAHPDPAAPGDPDALDDDVIGLRRDRRVGPGIPPGGRRGLERGMVRGRGRTGERAGRRSARSRSGRR